MENIAFALVFIVAVSIVLTLVINLYSAINTTLEVIAIKNKIKLKEYKKIHKDVF